MVGRFTLSSKHPSARESRHPDPIPPPPYRERAPPLLLAETTTTRTEVVTTTTQTTTHFFSLPLWRKRGIIASSSEKLTISAELVADDHGVISTTTNSVSFMVEKDLPPTPGEMKDTEDASGVLEGRKLASDLDPGKSPVTPLSPTRLPPVPQTTYALAHAALGLGLPHVLPHASTSSSSEVNTVAFTPTAPPSHEPRLTGLRRVKSTFKVKTLSERPSFTDGLPSEDGRRRARGLSFGTTSFLNFSSGDVKGKGKEADIGTDLVGQVPSKTVSRRASFWSRKKSTSSLEPTLVSSQGGSPDKPRLPPLPTVYPISPFNMDMNMIQPSSLVPAKQDHMRHHARGLSRSYSERFDPHRSSPMAGGSLGSDTPVNERATRSLERRVIATDPSARLHVARSMFLGSSLPSTPVASISTPLPPPIGHHHIVPPETNSQLPRPRAHTNPPMLHRLSLHLFSTPSPASSSNVYPDSNVSSFAIGPHDSPRSSLTRPSTANIPQPLTSSESPEAYLFRLLATVSKAEVAGVLASSSDVFYVKALRTYLEQFDFVDDPLDVALRKLLMEVGLPRETQQIDRVIEAFAGRYLQCNSSLFTSEDHPYILAFSLIMLHTDAFNKSNKRKMTKADYIKNTRLPGVAPEVLDCFYDNIVFAPFIFIEDPLDVNGQRGLTPDLPNRALPSSSNHSAGGVVFRANKVDPYYLIAHKLLGPLRVDIESYIPLESPYSYEGTAGPWNEEELLRAFALANVIEVGAPDQNRSTSFFNLGTVTGAPPSPLVASMGASPQIPHSTGDAWTLRVTKVGLLNRKDDVLEGGKKAMNRKWKLWSVILTGSQLLFFRDPSAATLLTQSSSPNGQIIYPESPVFRPDELLSVKDAIAVFDKSYIKYDNTLRFVMPDGRQLLLQASEELELNEWISRINYASAFKSAGVRMRPLGMSGKDVQLTGVAAAASHLHDMQHQGHSVTPRVRHWDGDAPRALMGMLSDDAPEPGISPVRRTSTTRMSQDSIDFDAPIAPEIDGADQFKATFDQVKADLAAGRWASWDDDLSSLDRPSPLDGGDESSLTSPVSAHSENSRLPSRSEILRSKVHDLGSRIAAAQTQLDSDMRFVRNIRTLTPFQKATRDRLTMAVQGVAKRVMQVRLNVTKLLCYRNVLSNDLASEGRDWNRAKKIALRAATDTLRSRRRVPRMTLSFHNDNSETAILAAETIPENLDTPTYRRPESSTCDSFHSAMDFGPDWSLSEDQGPGFLDAARKFDSPRHNSSGSLSSYPFPEMDVGSPKGTTNPLASSSSLQSPVPDASPRDSGELHSHEKFYTAQESLEEQAEEWNKTRCAHRVSLVRLPSNIGMPTRFERLGPIRRD